jgi:hypothetical protein
MSSSGRLAYVLLTAAVTSLLLAVPRGQQIPQLQRVPDLTFKVATWNVRSGMGIHGLGARAFNHESSNCTDPTKPLNAWGVGYPQQQLEMIRDDMSIVALAVQEAWNCASPRNINAILGFRTITREQEGVALAARYGFRGDPVYNRIDVPSDRWIIGGDVCLDVSCRRSVPMFSTHFGGKTDGDTPIQTLAALDFLDAQQVPHLFMGDLNMFQVDRWNPKVACTADTSPGSSEAIGLIARAGYIDAWKATQTGEGWTGMASRAGCGNPVGNLYKRVDYIQLRGLRPVSTTRFGRAAPGADSPSDHAGVIAEVALPGGTR